MGRDIHEQRERERGCLFSYASRGEKETECGGYSSQDGGCNKLMHAKTYPINDALAYNAS